METHDVVVVGAGLAGLRAATRLAEAGRDVVVLEAEAVVGGRERTDEVDGFLLDRGFHVLNPAYPAVKRWVDVDALEMQRFPVGVRVLRERGVVEVAHPLRHPSRLPASFASGLLTPRDLLALARWAGPVLAAPRRVIGTDDRTLHEGWDRAGLTGPLRTEVLEPFLAGVIAEDGSATSDAFAQLLVRMFALGRPGLPRRGIGALPAQLAEAARTAGARIRLSQRVERVAEKPHAVEVAIAGGEPIGARTLVVATGPDTVADLVDIPRPSTRGLQTWWFRADAAEAPASALLSVDGRRRGPIVNTVVMSRSAPSYAPPGQHLVQATCLLPASGGATPREDEVRRQLADLWGPAATTWRLLRRDDIPDALPAQPSPLRTKSRARLTERVYIAGDHRDTASIQGALVSGDRVARALMTAGVNVPTTAGAKR